MKRNILRQIFITKFVYLLLTSLNTRWTTGRRNLRKKTKRVLTYTGVTTIQVTSHINVTSQYEMSNVFGRIHLVRTFRIKNNFLFEREYFMLDIYTRRTQKPLIKLGLEIQKKGFFKKSFNQNFEVLNKNEFAKIKRNQNLKNLS